MTIMSSNIRLIRDPIPQKKIPKTLDNLSLFPWQMFWSTTFLSFTNFTIPSRTIMPRSQERINLIRIWLIKRKYHSDNVFLKEIDFTERLQRGCFLDGNFLNLINSLTLFVMHLANAYKLHFLTVPSMSSVLFSDSLSRGTSDHIFGEKFIKKIDTDIFVLTLIQE